MLHRHEHSGTHLAATQGQPDTVVVAVQRQPIAVALGAPSLPRTTIGQMHPARECTAQDLARSLTCRRERRLVDASKRRSRASAVELASRGQSNTANRIRSRKTPRAQTPGVPCSFSTHISSYCFSPAVSGCMTGSARRGICATTRARRANPRRARASPQQAATALAGTRSSRQARTASGRRAPRTPRRRSGREEMQALPTDEFRRMSR